MTFEGGERILGDEELASLLWAWNLAAHEPFGTGGNALGRLCAAGGTHERAACGELLTFCALARKHLAPRTLEVWQPKYHTNVCLGSTAGYDLVLKHRLAYLNRNTIRPRRGHPLRPHGVFPGSHPSARGCATRPRMHPLIARYLDLSNAVATLEKADQGGALDADEAAFAAEAKREPKMREALLKAKGRTLPSNQVQQQGIVLAVRAATARVFEDPALGPKAKAALQALQAEGASADEAMGLVFQIVLEEAFGYAEDPAAFDTAFVLEGFETLLPLSKVNEDLVDDWLERWSKAGPAAEKPMRLSVAETLLDAAWNDGPQPITPENLDDAVESIADAVAESEFPKAMDALSRFIAFLATEKIVGPLRAERLTKLVASASANSSGEVDDETEGDDEDEGGEDE